MCLISICPKGTEKNTDKVYDFIRSGFKCNKDGSGYMFKRNGENKITIKKGFFNDVEKMIDSIKSENLTIDDELAIHHRMGTLGLISQENTHPFVCSDVESEVSAVSITIDKPCMVHNGIFRGLLIFERMNPDFSDTYAFARYIAGNKHLSKMLDTADDTTMFKFVNNDIIGSNKICILHPTRDMITIGNFINNEGYLHSNDGYCRYVKNVGGVEDIDWEEYYGIRSKRNHSTKTSIGFQNPGKGKNHPKASSTGGTKVLLLDQNGNNKNIRKFDNTNMTITSTNSHHFYFYLKTSWESYLDKSYVKKYILEKPFNSSEINVVLNLVLTDEKQWVTFQCIPTQELIDKYYYVPKESYYKIYEDFYKLMTGIKDFGGKTLKKLNVLLNKPISMHKKDTDTIFYKKVGDFYTKGSLKAYKMYLEKLEELNNKAVISSNASLVEAVPAD